MPEPTTLPTPETPAAEDETLLTPEFLRKLEQLTLVLQRTFAGRMHGERRSTNRGVSVEFADFRNYTHGDDLRYVDWNIYARLDKLFLKLYVEEEDLHVHLLLDSSRSMGFGMPGKFTLARRIGAALGYIALNNLDRLSVTSVNDRLRARLHNVRGKGHVFPLFTWLQGLRAEGATDFARVLKDYALLARRPGMMIIISDFLAPGIEDGLRTLVGRKFAPTLIQVLSPEEIAPPYTGDLRLVDSETGDAREVSITSGLLARYRQRLEAHQAYLAEVCNRYGVNLIRTVTDEPFETLLLRYLKRRRVVE